MIDLKMLENKGDYSGNYLNDYKQGLINRGASTEILDKILDLAGRRRDLLTQAETAKAQQNKLSAEVGKLKREGKDAGPILAELEQIKGKVKELEVKEVSAMYSLVISMCYELKGAVEAKVDDKKFHEMADNFFGYMMKNFETELVVMGARIALTTYNLPFQPTKLKNFDEFHKRYGKYILQASA